MNANKDGITGWVPENEVLDVAVCVRVYRRTAKYCSSWTQLLAAGGVFVGYLGTDTIFRELQ